MSNEQKSYSKIFFTNLDGLRFTAFFMVYLGHSIKPYLNFSVPETLFQKVIDVLTSGGIGVSIFFVLSGFLITYLILSEINLRGRVNVGFFYIRRVLRIWPLYYAVIVFALIIYPYFKSIIGIHSDLKTNPIYYFTFLSNFDLMHIESTSPGGNAMMEGVTWSVAIEEQFYLVWPLLFFATPKRFFKFIFLFVLAVCLFFRLLNADDDTVLYYHSLSVCGDLAVGGLAAYFAFYSKAFKHFFERLSKLSLIFIYLAGFTWLLIRDGIFDSYASSIFSRLVSTLFFAFIILEQNYSINSFYKFSKSRFASFWGKYTYGLYLLHPVALLLLDIILRVCHISYQENYGLVFIVATVGLSLSLLMSYLSYEYYEKKFLQLKNKFDFNRQHKTNARLNTVAFSKATTVDSPPAP